jgi:hypothetical protein
MTTTVLTLTLTGLAADSSLGEVTTRASGGSTPAVRGVDLLGALAGALLLLRGVRWAVAGAALIAVITCSSSPRRAPARPSSLAFRAVLTTGAGPRRSRGPERVSHTL